MFVYQLLVPTTLPPSCLVTLYVLPSTMFNYAKTHNELYRGRVFLLHIRKKTEGRTTTSMAIYQLSELDGDPVYTFLTPEQTPPCHH